MAVPIAYAAAGERTSPRWCYAFAKGCGGKVRYRGLKPGPVAMFGSPALWNILSEARAEGRDWYYGDHAYFRRFEYYRVTRNAYQHDGSGCARGRRLEALGVTIGPWRKAGNHVLVCPPDAAFAALHGFDADGWLAGVLDTLGRQTDRPVHVRGRLGAEHGKPLAADLAGAWALVTYTSNAAVEAVIAGVPVFCTGACAASAMGLSDLAAIETPAMPYGRAQWARNLAANQWTFEEMKRGDCWRAIGDA